MVYADKLTMYVCQSIIEEYSLWRRGLACKAIIFANLSFETCRGFPTNYGSPRLTG